MSGPRIGELFAGYGGLGLAVQSVFGGSVEWVSEFAESPSKILEHHWPAVPNLGDITKIDWTAVEPVDILAGGFPCQDLSLAGARAGLKAGTRSGLWSCFSEAIAVLKPKWVVIENVYGILSAGASIGVEPCPDCVGDGPAAVSLRALGAVLGDLAGLGYDAEWVGLRAADAGAPHGRYRIFLLAYPANLGREWAGRTRERWTGPSDSCESSPDADDSGCVKHGRAEPVRAEHATTKRARDDAAPDAVSARLAWGQYAPAIRRWEAVTGRRAPAPTNGDGRGGTHRLSARFVEWMMGLDDGHVTDPAIGLSRSEQLRALGNGVVPRQAEMALRLLLART